MFNKKETVGQVCNAAGLTRAIEALPRSPALLILNYHRVGDAQTTLYDSATYSCTAEQLDWEVTYLKQRFPILNLEQAVDIIHGRATTKEASVLLTFDDGYRDNYDAGFPVFRKHDVPATFFLATSFVGTGKLPWWDIIAYIIKSSTRSTVSLTYPEPLTFDLSPAHRRRSVMDILKLFKRPAVTDTERFLTELESACDRQRPSQSSERCFLNWDEAREMQSAGMSFGSHTHTHEILSKLSLPQQIEELRTSRDLLERELGRTIDTLAYPVGNRTTFNDDTFTALREVNYTTAFSFIAGVNRPGQIDPFTILRSGVDGDTLPLFRLRVALRAVTRRDLI